MARPLHIAFFNRSYYPDLSATGQLLTELCEHLAVDYGCRVSVVAGVPLLPVSGRKANPGPWILRREEHRGVQIFRARGTRFSKNRFLGRFANYVSYFLSACYAGLRLDAPDLVVSLTDPPIIGVAGYLAARRFRAPFVFACKDVFPEVARLLEDFQSEFVELALQKVTCFLAARADRVVVLGETMRRRLVEGKGADPKHTVIIQDWSDCRMIRPGPRRNPFAKETGLEEKFVVMHSGNIGLSQGLARVLEAALPLQAWPDIRMVFVGEGVEKNLLRRRAAELGLENVLFFPFQPRERLIDSFATADLFLISLKRGLAGYIVPSKLYGILAAGRPFVAAVEEESEVAQISRRYQCGLLAEAGDPAGIARQVLRLYQDPELRRRLGRNARKAGLRFDRPRQVEAYYRLFRQLCPADSSRPALPRAKRAFDLALASLGLLLSAPLWGVIALAVKMEDGGPVFYGQQRVGRGGRLFRSWKFRSMVVHSDRDFGPLQAAPGDARVTRVGAILRASAMDELPQLWNIFKGEMSFVGPRALLPREIEVGTDGEAVRLDQIPGWRQRESVTPGLTGIAQIFAPRDVSRRHKFRLDRLYIGRRCLWLDLKLILLSFWITLRGKWEERGEKL